MNFLLPLQEIARIASERTLNSLLEGFGIAIFAWGLLQMIGRRNSGTRFAVWMAALAGIVALPFLGGASLRAGSASFGASSAFVVPASWATTLFLLWALIAGVLLARIALGMWHIHRLRHNACVIPSNDLAELPRTTLEEFNSMRAVTVRVSNQISVPTAIGFLRPAILLPSWCLQDLSAEELNSILIHELAHLQRHDDWTNLLQKVLRAVFFFHPAVWWVENRISIEREMACDDMVLARTANPRAYAECLVSVAEKSFVRRGFALAQAAVGKMRQTSQRISQILDSKRSPATNVWKPALGLVGLFSVVSVAFVGSAPELVAFRDPVVRVATAATGARPILASYPVAASSVKAASDPVHSVAKAHPRTEAVTARLGEAKAPKSNMETAAIVPAKLTQAKTQQPAGASQTMMVVFHSQQFNQGNVMWTVYVWQVTFVGQTQQITLPAKQI